MIVNLRLGEFLEFLSDELPLRINQCLSFIFHQRKYPTCLRSRQSASGFVFMLNGASVSWSCTHQPVLALSSDEAEFIAASSIIQ